MGQKLKKGTVSPVGPLIEVFRLEVDQLLIAVLSGELNEDKVGMEIGVKLVSLLLTKDFNPGGGE